MSQPRLAITLGDPAGIGPEIVLKALADPAILALAHHVVVGDRAALERTDPAATAALLRQPNVSLVDPGALRDTSDWVAGKLSAECGAAAVCYVKAATEMCLRGDAAAMVTAPLNKEAVTLSGMPFTGHTEYIAQLCGAGESRMLLINDKLAVVHVTTHVALRNACEVSRQRIVRTIELGCQAMRRLGFPAPRIAVCGLNPHAGENGLFGAEDAGAIRPAIEEVHQRGIPCEGPLAADTVFLMAARGRYDLVVAMYHDQGHIPMKLLDFEGTVNISLGLPVIRTSVDHGTAYDIVGRNQADPRSLKAAIRRAAAMAGASE
ncbi:MAG: 4-hydroxythreonine-4-phosphate dehydrogenase PdxA [Bryobacterales bacterium]|nr:4-hydroxythreonine-4-phosphate dehydrogenase PdxA [Bryobacterales bacterium]